MLVFHGRLVGWMKSGLNVRSKTIICVEEISVIGIPISLSTIRIGQCSTVPSPLHQLIPITSLRQASCGNYMPSNVTSPESGSTSAYVTVLQVTMVQASIRHETGAFYCNERFHWWCGRRDYFWMFSMSITALCLSLKSKSTSIGSHSSGSHICKSLQPFPAICSVAIGRAKLNKSAYFFWGVPLSVFLLVKLCSLVKIHESKPCNGACCVINQSDVRISGIPRERRKDLAAAMTWQ